MSTPVFGREPSRPLPADDEDEPTQEIEITDDPPSELDESSVAEREPDGSVIGVHEVDEGERDEPVRAGREPEGSVLDVGEVDEGERDEPVRAGREPEGSVLDVDEVDEGEPDEPVRAGREPEGSVLDVDEVDEGEPDEPAVEPVVLDAEGVSAEPAVEPVVPASAAPAPSANGLNGEWIELQGQFVDDPQGATVGALRMLREALEGLTPADASTEDLRVAFRRYRAAWFDLVEN
jgi:hypothetical protein